MFLLISGNVPKPTSKASFCKATIDTRRANTGVGIVHYWEWICEQGMLWGSWMWKSMEQCLMDWRDHLEEQGQSTLLMAEGIVGLNSWLNDLGKEYIL